jgi:hypothetical protein
MESADVGSKKMKIIGLLFIAVFMLAVQASAMEIILPRDVLEHFLIARPEQEFKQRADAAKILKHNKKHTEQYVIALLKSLQGGELKLKNKPDDYSLTVAVTAPKRIDFVFEKRLSKWVDGADYEYYVLIGINEEAPNTNLEPISGSQ